MKTETDNRSEEGDFSRQYRAEQQERRIKRLPIRTQDILDLEKIGYTVKKLTEYQYRVNSALDLFPIHAFWHDIKKNKRGKYNPNNLSEFIKNTIK